MELQLFNKKLNIKLKFTSFETALEYAETLDSKTYIVQRIEAEGSLLFKIKAIVKGPNNAMIIDEKVSNG